jgi:hypothetical protein
MVKKGKKGKKGTTLLMSFKGTCKLQQIETQRKSGTSKKLI